LNRTKFLTGDAVAASVFFVFPARKAGFSCGKNLEKTTVQQNRLPENFVFFVYFVVRKQTGSEQIR